MENWKPIKGYEGIYEVSDLGRIRSLPRTRSFIGRWGNMTTAKVAGGLLKPQRGTRGYMHIILSKDGIHEQVSVHRIVANAFCEHPVGKNEVNHKDENKANNIASNLEWCDRKYNTTYGSLKNCYAGEKNPRAKLTSKDVEQIKARRSNGEGLQTIASDYGISANHVSNICRGKRWAN